MVRFTVWMGCGWYGVFSKGENVVAQATQCGVVEFQRDCQFGIYFSESGRFGVESGGAFRENPRR
jgi:hypothetical protein